MVTKGYQKGVYDRVTEGTWESGRIGKSSRQSLVASLQQKTNGWTPRAIMARDVRWGTWVGRGIRFSLCELGADDGRQNKDDKSEKCRSRKTPYHMPNHDAHRDNSPRGGVREWTVEGPQSRRRLSLQRPTDARL